MSAAEETRSHSNPATDYINCQDMRSGGLAYLNKAIIAINDILTEAEDGSQPNLSEYRRVAKQLRYARRFFTTLRFEIDHLYEWAEKVEARPSEEAK